MVLIAFFVFSFFCFVAFRRNQLNRVFLFAGLAFDFRKFGGVFFQFGSGQRRCSAFFVILIQCFVFRRGRGAVGQVVAVLGEVVLIVLEAGLGRVVGLLLRPVGVREMDLSVG